MKYFVFLVSMFLIIGFSNAREVEVRGASLMYSCFYYSGTQGFVDIVYVDHDLPWGTTVELDYGFEKQDFNHVSNDSMSMIYPWQHTATKKMEAIGPWTWKVSFSKQINTRGQSYRYVGVDFCFRLIKPDGTVEYEKGSLSPMGHYKVSFPHQSGCMDSSSDPVDSSQYATLEVETVEKF